MAEKTTAAIDRETVLKHGLRDVLLIGAGYGIRHTMTDKEMVGAMMDAANAALTEAREVETDA